MSMGPHPRVPYLSSDMDTNISSFVKLMKEEGLCTIFDFQESVKKAPYKQAEILDIVPILTEMVKRGIIEKRTISVSEPADQWQMVHKTYGFFLKNSEQYYKHTESSRYGFDYLIGKYHERNARIT